MSIRIIHEETFDLSNGQSAIVSLNPALDITNKIALTVDVDYESPILDFYIPNRQDPKWVFKNYILSKNDCIDAFFEMKDEERIHLKGVNTIEIYNQEGGKPSRIRIKILEQTS